MSDTWKTFETSGKVEDYLSFCHERNDVTAKVQSDNDDKNQLEMLGENKDGNKCHSDGNGIDSYAHW